MSWRAISPVLVVAVMCPACVGADRTSSTERSGAGAAPSATCAPEGADEASGELTSSPGENNPPDEAYSEEDGLERTGEAAQAEEGYPEVRDPWGDGRPDDHTYTGGPPGRWGKDQDSPGTRRTIGSGGNSPGSVDDFLRREQKRREQRALAWRTKAAIQEDFAHFQSEARKRIGGGGSVDHSACVWTCEHTIVEACEGIQALCAGNPVIMLSPHVTISCMTAIFTACFAGRLSSMALCETIVCAGVR